MRRTKQEIINDINQVQATCDRLIMNIGQGYSRVRLMNDNSLITEINQKIDAYKKAESQMKALEQELANTTD